MRRYLQAVPLLRDVPAKALDAITPGCELRHFRKGEVLFKEGEQAEWVWIVRRGWVSLLRQTPQKQLVTIFVMTPDEALCGVSAFERGRYSASAVAATDTQVVRIPAEMFERLLERYPAFGKAVLLTCCQRIRHMADAISLAQAPVEQRIAYTLLRLHTTFGRTIPVTHQELARMAGTRWETSIRTLSAMKRRGWIASSRGRVTLLAPQHLQALLHLTNGFHHDVRHRTPAPKPVR
ncbi:MAG: Crp/Fnr family transcriptional regulator [Candidatus Omnitrophica bacterium]|nr:Crp/Fnr family transcriptional regulator [Candidatus Omnitrophota bacterium]